MTVTIEKAGDQVRVELRTTAAAKPVEIKLSPAQIDVLVQVLQTAARVDAFRLQTTF